MLLISLWRSLCEETNIKEPNLVQESSPGGNIQISQLEGLRVGEGRGGRSIPGRRNS